MKHAWLVTPLSKTGWAECVFGPCSTYKFGFLAVEFEIVAANLNKLMAKKLNNQIVCSCFFRTI